MTPHLGARHLAGSLLLLVTAGIVSIASGGDAARSTDPVAGREGGRQDTTEFRHADHRGLGCLTCHSSAETHGGLTVTRPEDCLRCHHQADDAPPCGRCHAPADLRRSVRPVRRPLVLSVGKVEGRSLPFAHARHEDVACADCHTDGPRLSSRRVSCAECHEEHHRLASDCSACHAEPPGDAHPVEVAHVTCGGSGCHASLPFPRVPRSRPACLVCHQDMVDHRPGRPCTECHAMPRRETAPGAGSPSRDPG